VYQSTTVLKLITLKFIIGNYFKIYVKTTTTKH